MRLERDNECTRWRHVWCIYPFGHHLKAGEVFLQGLQLAAVATGDDARSGNHRSPAEESKAAFDFLQLALPCRGVALCEDRFVHCHDDAPVELNQLNKVATDEVVKFLQGFVAFSDIIFKQRQNQKLGASETVSLYLHQHFFQFSI